MLVEQRTYTFKMGKLPRYLEIYEKEGLPVQREYLPSCVGYYVTEIGELNQVVHLWAYDSFEHRAECRARMRADPRWAPYLAKIHPLLAKQRCQLLTAAPFFDLKALLAGKRPL
jgi:hypothetical protein